MPGYYTVVRRAVVEMLLWGEYCRGLDMGLEK